MGAGLQSCTCVVTQMRLVAGAQLGYCTSQPAHGPDAVGERQDQYTGGLAAEGRTVWASEDSDGGQSGMVLVEAAVAI